MTRHQRIVWILNHHGTEDILGAVLITPIILWLAQDGVGLSFLGLGWVWYFVPPILFGYGVMKWRILGPDARGSNAKKGVDKPDNT